ncbi:hypothetical protein B9Z19DRAFT_1121016 [Tuber borchii]|uniref:Uncharacterized protein n=1 Tax=Tuber borchii TaxID=42251 RepID=A0A2T7A3H2_TUBBO|nr:hypothetical protein B9Z19DRAFT_1121016 [Tuber borchii]
MALRPAGIHRYLPHVRTISTTILKQASPKPKMTSSDVTSEKDTHTKEQTGCKLKAASLESAKELDIHPQKRKTKVKFKIATAYSKVSVEDAEKRLGLMLDIFETYGISISRMLDQVRPNINGLGEDQLHQVKCQVYQNILDFLLAEGYPAMVEDFTEANVTDLALLIMLPILTALQHIKEGRLSLIREKEIIKTDFKTQPGGYREFIGMDTLEIGKRKFVLVVEAKNSNLALAKRQCLLALKDMRDNNRGGVVYGFVTTGELWQMILYDGKDFKQTGRFEVLFHSMENEKETWMEQCSIIVDLHGLSSVNRTKKISGKYSQEFLWKCLLKYEKTKVEPRSAVGAVGIQSIDELGTLTLKAFHCASKVISTPIVTCMLVIGDDERAARIVKGRIERTFLEDVGFPPSLYSYKITRLPPAIQLHQITSNIEDVCSRDNNLVSVCLDQVTISKLDLELIIAIE